MKANYKPLGYFFIVYGLLYLLFVRGIGAPVDIDEVRLDIEDITEDSSSLISNVTVMSLLVSSAVNVNGEVTGLYQVIFLIISALALIWLFRQQQAGNKVGLRDAYYRGMYPLIPFTLIVLLIGLQTVPASIGNFLFTTVTEAGLAVSMLEQLVWLFLYISLIILSLYLVSSSIIALFVVTLPEMTPRYALKKAKELVEFRRLSIILKIFALLLFVLLAIVIFVLPSLYISSILAQLVFFIVTVLIIPFSVAYLFILYRELI